VEQDELLRYTVDLLERLQIPYMLVGSLASGVYGEPRLTQDIDVVISPTTEQLGDLCAAFPASEFYVNRDAALEALRRRDQFNVLDPSSGNKIDFMIAKNDAWGTEQFRRRERVQLLPGHHGFAARPEDVILSKMLYYAEGGSEKHLRDITGMLKASSAFIDRGYIERWSNVLGVSEIWRAILSRVGEQA
jgi:hypothetical protein